MIVYTAYNHNKYYLSFHFRPFPSAIRRPKWPVATGTAVAAHDARRTAPGALGPDQCAQEQQGGLGDQWSVVTW